MWWTTVNAAVLAAINTAIARWAAIAFGCVVLAYLWAAPPGAPPEIMRSARAGLAVAGLAMLITAMPTRTRAARRAWFGALFLLGALFAGGILLPARIARGTAAAPPRPAAILAVNDIYRIEGKDAGATGGIARLRTLRHTLEQDYDVLVLHAGDVISPSPLDRYGGRAMIDVMNLLDGNPTPGVRDERLVVAFGNHEFDGSSCTRPDKLRERVAESDFYWIGSNIHFDACPIVVSDNVIGSSRIFEIGGIKIGVFSLTTDLEEADVPRIDGRAERRRLAAMLAAQLRRDHAQLVVALTHLSIDEDLELLRETGPDGPDMIIGGHDHTRMVHEVNGRRVYKADADAATASLFTIRLDGERRPVVTHRFVHLDWLVAKDPMVDIRVEQWLANYARETCGEVGKPPSCLADPVVKTEIELAGDETKIRSSETALGDVIADQMLQAHWQAGDPAAPPCPVPDAAFINSGSLRLNTDIRAGSVVTFGDIDALIRFPTELHLVTIKGSELLGAIEHSVTSRGSGPWLQVSGLRIAYDQRPEPKLKRAELLSQRAGGAGWIELAGPHLSEEFAAVTTDYLAGGKDGFGFRYDDSKCSTRPLKELLLSELQRMTSIKPFPLDRIVCGDC